jgi:hypothetical protein
MALVIRHRHNSLGFYAILQWKVKVLDRDNTYKAKGKEEILLILIKMVCPEGITQRRTF